MNGRPVAGLGRAHEKRILERPPVHEQLGPATGRLGVPWTLHETGDLEPARGVADRDERPGELAAPDARQPLLGRLVRRHHEARRSIHLELEPHVGMGQRERRHRLVRRTGLARGGAKKLPAGRRIEEQGTHRDRRASLPHRVRDAVETPPVTVSSVPPSASVVASPNRETDAIAGSASPRKPNVATPTRSAALRTLLVAWRSRASTHPRGPCRSRRRSPARGSCPRSPAGCARDAPPRRARSRPAPSPRKRGARRLRRRRSDRRRRRAGWRCGETWRESSRRRRRPPRPAPTPRGPRRRAPAPSPLRVRRCAPRCRSRPDPARGRGRAARAEG